MKGKRLEIRDYNDVIDLAEEIYEEAMLLKPPHLDKWDLSRGFESSQRACRQEEKVYYSPLMKNALKMHGDSEDMTIKTPRTKAEDAIDKNILKELEQYGVTDEYDVKEPLDSPKHYGVDCRRNYHDNLRQIQPGQEDERREAALEFGKRIDPKPFFKLMREDKLMQLAISRVLDMLPRVLADSDFTETSAPFETKHTNVGAYWWYVDKVLAPDGETYGHLALEVAKSQTYSSINEYNLCTFFGRNQRGKGRLLIAASRVANLWLNRLEAREIEKYKSVPYFIGYNDDQILKQGMTEMLKYAIANGLVAWNWDQRHFDQHINPALLALVGAISIVLAGNALGKRLARKRAVFNIHSWAVNGMTGQVEEIFGRMFSGFIDTNRADGLVEAVIFTWALMRLDKAWTRKVARTNHFMFGMGDDLLALIDPTTYDPAKLSSIMQEAGFELNTEKSAFGIFFLQYRLFRYNDEYVMVYPWTRVVRSMLFLETPRGLGPYGWLLSQYQQLSKLIEYPPALDSAIKILLKYDKLQFGVNDTVETILQHVKEEDAEAKDESKGSQFRTTADKLYDGDPTKARWFNGDEINSSYLSYVHDAISDSVKRVTSSMAQPA